MTGIDFYYQIKPAIPRHLQIYIRRAVAARKKRASNAIWPIDSSAAKPPRDWPGWPEKKQFALILQHDVDSLKGLKKVARLAEMERQMGFRSSFNFVPEDYPTPFGLTRSLSASGFEVGVHGLKHDGKLFRSLPDFCSKVPRINHYLKAWEAVGFTSPSMLCNLEWLAALEIEHSCSTFDTDPFEPQSEGVASIFPFLAPKGPESKSYVELPYTLPQDHCLFIILKETDIGIWRRKLDWIAENGGMASFISHPDYMHFEGAAPEWEEYPAEWYRELLDYIKEKYDGRYWNVLPRELARFWRTIFVVNGRRESTPVRIKPPAAKSPCRQISGPGVPAAKIWIDLDNTPHVPFFIPIIRELERRGHEVVLTARDAFQVCELAAKKGLRFHKIGRHYGKNPFMKIIGLVVRAAQLLPFYLRQKPRICLSHGARSQNLVGNLFRVPTVLIADYEYARTAPLTHPRWTIVPDVISPEGLPSKISHVRYYRGIKEDIYVPEFKPSISLLAELGLRNDELIITVRPPANEAHYYNPESDLLFHELMSRICQSPGVRAVLLPRNKQQEGKLRIEFPDWFEGRRTIIPTRVVDGLDLLWISDLVVSGGGTMNREAAALGIPVYSIFRGKTGAVDRMLEDQGRLRIICDQDDIWSKIAFVRRDKNHVQNNKAQEALQDIIGHIEDIIQIESGRPFRWKDARHP